MVYLHSNRMEPRMLTLNCWELIWKETLTNKPAPNVQILSNKQKQYGKLRLYIPHQRPLVL